MNWPDIHPLAEAELGEAARFYEDRLAGLGGDFLDEYERCLVRLNEFPDSGVICYKRFRRLLLRRFPFSVIYELVSGSARIVAVAHQRRIPGYWRKRV